MEVLLCECVNDLRHSLFHLLNSLINDSLWALGITKNHREQGLDYWETRNCLDAHLGQIVCNKDEVWDFGTDRNATDPIWRVLASSDGISSWTTLKPQHSNPNPNPLANQLRCIDFLTPPTPPIIPHRLPGFPVSLMPLKNWCWIHARWSKSSLKHSIRFCGIFSKLKTDFFACRSSKVSSCPDCIFENHQLWQSGFSRVYTNSCCSCWFEPEIITIGQSSDKMYSNKILNFQESATILNAWIKKSGILLKAPRIYIRNWH